MTAVQPRATDKRDAAIELARAGFSVFPLVPNGKTPAIENWQNLATTDLQQIMGWWASRPTANIGIHTANLLVVDIDPDKGGRESFAALAMTEEFPDTAASKTRSGGTHLLYALPPHTAVKNSVGKLGDGLDTRSQGGFIVAAGSTIDGKEYAWLPGCSPDEQKIASAPQWLIDKCNSAHRKTRQAGQRIIDEDETALDMAEAYLQHNAPEAIQGGRDHTAYKLAAALYDFGISKETCEALMLEWNEGWCHPSLEAHEIERIVWSASTNRDNAIGSKHPSAPGFEPVEIAPPPVRNMYTQIGQETPAKSRFYAVRADEGAKRALANPGDPLIKGVIHRGAMSVVIGAPGGGKTFLMLDWAYHIATGKPWADKPVKQGAVVYLAAEAGNMIMSRLAALEAHYGPLNDAPLFIVPCSADFAHGPDDAAALLALIRDIEAQCGQKVELFVVDTLNRAIAGGDENSSKDVGALIRNVDLIREQAKVHALVIHHPGKDAAKGGRGHSSVLGGTDTEIIISNHTLKFTKQRDMPQGDDIEFSLKPIVIGVDADGEPVTSCYVEVRKPGQPREKLTLTPGQEELMAELRSRMTTVVTTIDRPMMQECQHAIKVRTGEIDGTIVSVDDLKESTAKSALSELTEKGWLKKGLRGQWVIV